jgi:hypothetical protein
MALRKELHERVKPREPIAIDSLRMSILKRIMQACTSLAQLEEILASTGLDDLMPIVEKLRICSRCGNIDYTSSMLRFEQMQALTIRRYWYPEPINCWNHRQITWAHASILDPQHQIGNRQEIGWHETPNLSTPEIRWNEYEPYPIWNEEFYSKKYGNPKWQFGIDSNGNHLDGTPTNRDPSRRKNLGGEEFVEDKVDEVLEEWWDSGVQGTFSWGAGK